MTAKMKLIGVYMIVMAMLLSACGGSLPSSGGDSQSGMPVETATDGGGPDKQIDIKIYGSWGTEQPRGVVLQERIEKFNELHKGKINVTMDLNSEWDLYLEKVKTMIAANQTPDLFTFNFNPMDLSRQESGKLLDFNKYMDDEWRNRFKAEELNAMVVNGELNSIPFESSGLLFYYNKDLFAQAGIDKFPETWDEFFEACEKLQAIGIAPLSLMTVGDAFLTMNLFTYIIGSAGGMDALAVGESINTPEMVKAATTLRKMFNYTTSDALGADYNIAENHFLLEQSAIIVNGPWLTGRLDEKMSTKIGLAGGPTYGDAVAKPGFIVTDAYTPWAGAKHDDSRKEEAVAEFMKFLTNEESSKQFALHGGVSLSAKLNLNEEEKEIVGALMSEFTQSVSEAPESLVQLSRVIKPAAASELSGLLEALILDQITPEQFAEQLNAANQ